MKTKNVNLTVKLLVAVLMLISDISYAQTHTISSREFIKFNTENRNNPTIAFDASWNGYLRYQRNTGKFYFNKKLTVPELQVIGDEVFLNGSNAHDTYIFFEADGDDSAYLHYHRIGDEYFQFSKPLRTNELIINWGGSEDLAQVSINTDSKVDHAALTVAGGVYIGPKADLASENNLDRFEASYLGDFKLWVEDGIITERYGVSTVEDHQWRDMVLDKDYALPGLDEVREYINTHGHLKDVPSAKEVEENGYDLVDMDATLLQKIEELMLYTLEQKQQIDDLKNEIQELKEEKNIKTINSKTKI
jgi:hypothetical protein